MTSVETRSPPTIPPFWQRLNKFFMFPLQTEALTYGLGLVACSLLLYIPLVNVIVFFVIMLAIARYAFKIAALSSYGIFRLDDYIPMQEEEDWKKLPWKFVGAIILQSLAVVYVAVKIPQIAPVAFLLSSLVMPATIMVLIKDHSLRSAINPLALWRCIRSIGWHYLVLWAFNFLLMQGIAVAASLLRQVIPMWLLPPGMMLIFIYFFWVDAALIGYTMYQYHQALDIDVVNEYDESEDGKTVALNPREEAHKRDAVVSRLVQQGKMQEALSQAQQWLKEAPENLSEHRRYHRLLLLGQDSQELQRHGQQFVVMLLKNRSSSEALLTYKACVRKVDGFVPGSAVVTLALAKFAWKEQNSILTLQLVRGFDQRFPQHALTPAVYALVVRVLHQGLQRHDQAKSVFLGLQKRYPDSLHTREAAYVLRS